MLDPNLLRNELDAVAEKLARRGFKLDVDTLRQQEERRKVLQVETESLQAERNSNPSVRLKRVGKTLNHCVLKSTNWAKSWMRLSLSWISC